MPYSYKKTKKGYTVYHKGTNRIVGTTKGSVKKYLQALEINAMKNESFKEYFTKTLGTTKRVNEDDMPSLSDEIGTSIGLQPETKSLSQASKHDIVNDTIETLEDIALQNQFPVGVEILNQLADDLRSVDIEPSDIIAAINHPDLQKLFLITGPGVNGSSALKDLKKFQRGEINESMNRDPKINLYNISNLKLDLFDTNIQNFKPDKQYGTTASHALNLYLFKLAAKNRGKFWANANLGRLIRQALDNGVKIDLEVPKPEPEKTYWWNDKD